MGLLEDSKAIYDLRGWQQCLADCGAELRGYRLVWRPDATDYQQQAVIIHSESEH